MMSARKETWPKPHRLTVDDYYRMTEAGVLSPDDRTELIEGEIIDMAPIGIDYAEVVRRLNRRLMRAVGDSAEVTVEQPVRLSLRSEPHPDLALLKPRPTGHRRAHPSAADVLLLIEVSDSTLHYDLEVKTRLYARHAVPEYCVVDLVANRIWRHRRPDGQGYAQRDEIREGTLELPVNGGEIVVPDLFTP
jgi:Uma2 family endonuclease